MHTVLPWGYQFSQLKGTAVYVVRFPKAYVALSPIISFVIFLCRYATIGLIF